jgi:hypothetical protein
VLSVVEDRRGQGSVGSAIDEPATQVVERAHAARRDDGHRHPLGHRAGQLQVVALASSVAIHARQQDLPRSHVDHSRRPVDGIQPGGRSSAMRKDFPLDPPARAPASRVDRHDDGLASPGVGRAPNELRLANGGGVDGNLIGSRAKKPLDMIGRRDSAAHQEWGEDDVGGVGNDVQHGLSAFVRRRDVEESNLVRALAVVARSALDRVAGIAKADEIDAFDDPPGFDVQTRDDALGQHGKGFLADASRTAKAVAFLRLGK